jgi:single-stranded DNA-binding protein
MKILIVGEIEIDEYIDKDGNKQKSIQIVGDKCEIMSNNEKQSEPIAKNESKQTNSFDLVQSDDLPF